ncbi:hypothetical protein [Azohydromonas aeria]|uniref:hypothetical protein n=1 Tax=Azohydromonas aeria TaxID=2590212 RepID=UPI0018DFE54D|nr:hypothetical protein [Azohydromonas aeria]
MLALAIAAAIWLWTIDGFGASMGPAAMMAGAAGLFAYLWAERLLIVAVVTLSPVLALLGLIAVWHA